MNFSNFPKMNSILTSLFFLFLFTSIEVYAGTKTITVKYKEKDVTFSKQKGYDIVSLPEFDFIDNPLKVGEPMMPVKTIRILIPSETEVTNVRIISTKEKLLDGKYYLHPIQYPLYGEEAREFVEPNEKIYSSMDTYPGKVVEFRNESYFREYHIVEVLIYPFQYRAAQKELTLNTEISFEIEYSTSTKYDLLPRLRQNEKTQNDIKEKLKRLISNPEDVSSNTFLPPQIKTSYTTIIYNI